MSRSLRLLAVVAVVVPLVLVAADRLAPHTTAALLLRLERARAGLETRRVRVGDLDVAYLEGGSGEPLVLLHGFGADKDHFTRVSAHLTASSRVLVPDLPGFGESSRPPDAAYTIEAQVARVQGFARALGVERMHLGGSSMGGMIATAYALAYPAEIRSLWLLAPAGTRVAFASELTRAIGERGENPLLPRTREDFARTIDFVMAARPFMPHSILSVLAERAVADHALHRRIFEVVGPGRVSTLDERLKRLSMPTLVVWGADDRALAPAAAAVYRAAVPRVEVVVLDRIGHLPMLEAPAETAKAYLDFRARLP
jgi:pimeloyl-ACP methyl ester carboxylesterase